MTTVQPQVCVSDVAKKRPFVILTMTRVDAIEPCARNRCPDKTKRETFLSTTNARPESNTKPLGHTNYLQTEPMHTFKAAIRTFELASSLDSHVHTLNKTRASTNHTHSGDGGERPGHSAPKYREPFGREKHRLRPRSLESANFFRLEAALILG